MFFKKKLETHKSLTKARAEATRALRFLEFAIDQTPVAVMIAEAPDVSITHYNQAAKNILAVPVDDLSDIPLEVHREYWPTFYPDGTAYDHDDLPLTRAIKHGHITRNVEIIVRKSDGDRWISASAAPLRNEKGQIIAGIVAFPDITELKRAEAALLHSEKKYRYFFNNTMIGFFRTRIDDGLFLEVNQGLVEMMGYGSREELVGKLGAADTYVALESRTRLISELEEKGEVKNFETRLKKRDGSILWVRFSATLYEEKGYLEGILTDITETREAEVEKARLERQYHQVQKMESIGRLAGGVAHDFNNMLGVILGLSEMALMEIEPDQPLFPILSEIKKAAEHSSELTSQLLAFARKQPVTPKVLDLNVTMEGMLQMLRRLIGENIDLTWRPGSDLWAVKIDPTQLDQMLANLCLNARDAIAGGGTITIKTSNATAAADERRGPPGLVRGEFVLLTVVDNGSGMDKDVLEHIFEPFFTTKEITDGTGLGLATVYGITKQNKGFIKVDSEPGRGTTFKIYLPRHRGKINPVQEVLPDAPAVGGNETILLVEDQPEILNITRMMLELLGYTVLPSSRPMDAIEQAEGYDGTIHMLISDVVMPGMNGRELSAKLIRRYPNLKCLYMSGYTADIIADQGVLDKDINFIQKPFTKDSLGAKINEVFQRG